jgi:hypothetical protein
MPLARRQLFALWGLCALALPEPEAWAAPSAEDAAVKAIRDLDIAARFEEDQIKDLCHGIVNLGAEASALSAAYIHQARLGRAKSINASDEELVTVAFQATDDFQRAYACNPDLKHLAQAERLLTQLLSYLPESSARARGELQDALVVFAGLIQSHPTPARSVPLPMPGPRSPTLILEKAEVKFRDPLRDTYLGRLSLRIETGYGRTDLEPGGDGYTHAGVFFRAQFLARFTGSERRRVILLFGPYYDHLSANQLAIADKDLGFAHVHSFGGHFELQWTPSRRVNPRLSLHPFVDVGIGYVSFQRADVPNRGGGQLGGGAAICIWNAAFCPNVRFTTLPSLPRAYATIQVGLAIDLLRLIDASLARRSSVTD